MLVTVAIFALLSKWRTKTAAFLCQSLEGANNAPSRTVLDQKSSCLGELSDAWPLHSKPLNDRNATSKNQNASTTSDSDEIGAVTWPMSIWANGDRLLPFIKSEILISLAYLTRASGVPNYPLDSTWSLSSKRLRLLYSPLLALKRPRTPSNKLLATLVRTPMA